jgi:hypothetical protein
VQRFGRAILLGSGAICVGAAACALVDPVSRLESDLDAAQTPDVTVGGDVGSETTSDSTMSDAMPDTTRDVVAMDTKEAGPPDSCTPPGDADPCMNVPSADNGCYCGLSTQYMFNPSAAVPTCLYDCQDGGISHTVLCPQGCTLNQMNMQDFCMGSFTNCG